MNEASTWYASRRAAADRQPPLANGQRDPLAHRLPDNPAACSRAFACLAQTIDTLQRAHHCPCHEAEDALSALMLTASGGTA